MEKHFINVVEDLPVMIFSEEKVFATGRDPHDAMVNWLLNPKEWPEQVDFWIELVQSTHKSDAGLGYIPDGMKRLQWHNAAVVRFVLDYDFQYVRADFWFFVAFLDALTNVPDLSWANNETVCSGRVSDIYFDPDNMPKGIHKRSDWLRNPRVAVIGRDAYHQVGLECPWDIT